jgi:hypothetical protein
VLLGGAGVVLAAPAAGLLPEQFDALVVLGLLVVQPLAARPATTTTVTPTAAYRLFKHFTGFIPFHCHPSIHRGRARPRVPQSGSPCAGKLISQCYARVIRQVKHQIAQPDAGDIKDGRR